MEGPPNPIPMASSDVIHSVEACWLGQAQAGLAAPVRFGIKAYCSGGEACKPAPRSTIWIACDSDHAGYVRGEIFAFADEESAQEYAADHRITCWEIELKGKAKS